MDDVSEGATSVVARLDGLAQAVMAGLDNRRTNLAGIGSEWDAFLQAMAADGHGIGSILAVALLAAVLAGVTFLGLRALLARHAGWPSARPIAAGLVVTALAVITVIVLARIGLSGPRERHVAQVWGLAVILALLVRQFLAVLMSEDARAALVAPKLQAFADSLSIGIAWGLIGLAALSTLTTWGAGPGLRDLAGTFLITPPVIAILVVSYWRFRRVVTVAVSGPAPISPWRARFADAWPVLAILALVGTVLSLQLALTLGRPLPSLALLGTLLLVLVAPHVDSAIALWAERKERATSSGSLVPSTLRRMARFAFLVLVLVLLGYEWALPGLTALGIDVSVIRVKSLEIGLVALCGAFAWNVVAVAVRRLDRQEHQGPADDETHVPHTRLETLLPLLAGTAKVTILVLSVLTILVILEVNVWPLITGLSVFGLAIGFGSQTLVKDIVSGLFFLLDDAFRLGEYIETSGAKGTVEKISVRSVTLRHSRGAVATIPYGQIGKIQNYSRDWVIEKLVFRVAFETDVEQVRKLFKQIGKDIAADPELSPDLIEPFKSQGIAAVEDGTLLVRGKFKARAGKQFGIRKAVLEAVQDAFTENGIRVVPRPGVPAGPQA
jgi:moderate conductance mechanosensitive channel